MADRMAPLREAGERNWGSKSAGPGQPQWLESAHANTGRPPRVVDIQKAVAEHFGCRLIDMKSHRRSVSVARPRQVAMYLARELTPLSLPAIGRHFGGRDHTTVLHALRRIQMLAELDRHLATSIARARASLLPPDDPDQMELPLAAHPAA